jgi:cation diffusion facilitator CzcD-associated flavoprotein CzcO
MSSERPTTANGTGARQRVPTVIIVGAGMSGLYMAARLKHAGIDSFTVFEKADSVGGVWRDNRYPGLTCDVPSRSYTFHFELNPDWTRFASPAEEIWEYFNTVAQKHDLIRHIRFGTEVSSAEIVDGRWVVHTATGEQATADFLITACGVLRVPTYPSIAGMDSFEGAMFHSVHWDHSLPLEGKRIAVVGTGSTGVQLVVALGDVAGKLVHFQRSPQWIFPMPNMPYSKLTRWLLRRIPHLNRMSFLFWKKLHGTFTSRMMVEKGVWRNIVIYGTRLNLRFGVRDSQMRRRLTPSYSPGCKRIVMSSRFYKTLRRPNVEVVTDTIERIVPTGLVTSDGRLHEADIIVLATGFNAQAYIQPLQITGTDGADIGTIWGAVPRGYQTIAMPGFPNFFMMSGPHNPLGNQAVTTSARTQSRYIMQWLELYRAGAYDLAEPTAEATRAFNDELIAAYPNDTVWASGCQSYYLGADGLPSVWPWRAERYDAMLARPNLADFMLRQRPARAPSEYSASTRA